MSKPEAEEIFRRLGCLDLRSAGCRHIAYCAYIDRVSRGECKPERAHEAYWVLQQPAPEPEQPKLFETLGADL